jgi:adenosine deaminase
MEQVLDLTVVRSCGIYYVCTYIALQNFEEQPRRIAHGMHATKDARAASSLDESN